MTSCLVLPSLTRRSLQIFVSGSWVMRTITMRHNALFAWRLPLSRTLTLSLDLPDPFGMGDAPHR